MKKIITVLSLCAILSPAVADTNVLFGDKINSIMLYGAQGTGSGSLLKLVQPGIWEFNPQTLIMAQYSQPMKFFRLDSRLNLNVGQNFAYKSSHGFTVGKIISGTTTSKVKIKLYELFDIDWRVLAYVILFFSNIVNL